MQDRNIGEERTRVAKAYFAAMEPYVNTRVNGRNHVDGKPRQTIRKSTLQKTHAQRDPEERREFQRGLLNWQRIAAGIHGDTQHFTCSKVSGRSLLYFDVDTKHIDLIHRTILVEALGQAIRTGIFSNDGRIYMKFDWRGHGFEEFRILAMEFTAVLRTWAEHHGYQATIDGFKGIHQLGRMPLKDATMGTVQAFEDTADMTMGELQDVIDQIRKATPDGIRARPKSMAFETIPDPAVPVRKTSAGMPMTDDDYESIPGLLQYFRDMSGRIRSNANLVDHKVKHQKIHAMDIAQALTILFLFRSRPNSDGSIPTARVELWWRHLCSAGYFTRCWDNSKWRAVRNIINDAGLLEFADNRYWFDPKGESAGQAMKWSLKEAVQPDPETPATEGIQSLRDDFLHDVGVYIRPLLVWPRRTAETGQKVLAA
jgi:hypothetical protein